MNQSNRSISVRLLFLFYSRVFISRLYENRSIVNLLGLSRSNSCFEVFSIELVAFPLVLI